MKVFSLILIIYSLTVGKVTTQDAVGRNSREKKVLKLINSLPEVAENNKFILEKTAGKRELKAYIEDTPSRTHHYYVVSVSEYNGVSLVPHFWFRVNEGTNAISYIDAVNNKLVPYNSWHKHPYGIYSK